MLADLASGFVVYYSLGMSEQEWCCHAKTLFVDAAVTTCSIQLLWELWLTEGAAIAECQSDRKTSM